MTTTSLRLPDGQAVDVPAHRGYHVVGIPDTDQPGVEYSTDDVNDAFDRRRSLAVRHPDVTWLVVAP